MRSEATKLACRENGRGAVSGAARIAGTDLFDCPFTLADPVLCRLPPLFRVESICRLPVDESRHVARAELFHSHAALSVFWVGGRNDTSIANSALVSIRWLGDPICCDGALRIARLIEIEEPEASFNLFETVPPGWVADRMSLNDAAARWRQASHGSRRSFNARCWNASSFRSYLASCGAATLSH